MEIYEIIFSSSEFKTVGEYVADGNSPAIKYINKEEAFLAVKNSLGKTNRDSILEKHKGKNLIEKYAKLPAKDLPIKFGTRLAIPANEIERIGLLTQGLEVVSNNVPAFKARALAELQADSKYNPVKKTALNYTGTNRGKLVESSPEYTVWVWCRALSTDKQEENEGQIFNITPFVQKVTTNVGKNGGNFQITLPPLTCEIENGKWIIKKESVVEFENTQRNTQQGGSYVASVDILTEDNDGETRRSQFLFHNILQANDIVWIRFETLEMEKDQRIIDNKGFTIDKSDIPGRIYDMIGLIDENQQTISGANNDVSINIQGRDLSKLFIEDGTYFYALEMAQGQMNFTGGSTQRNELMQRVFTDNALIYFGLYFNNSIENVFKFVIQQLSSIKIAPDSLFESYGDRRSKRFNSERQYLQQNQNQSTARQNLISKGYEAIKTVRKSKGLTNASANEEQKQAIKIWDSVTKFFTAMRDQKAAQATGWNAFRYGIEQLAPNTYPSSFYSDLKLMTYSASEANQNGEQALINVVNQYIDINQSHPPYKDLWKEEPAPGIWSIIKLVIDEGVAGRRIVDSSASSANGSLINFFRKVCQEPFVEFYMDTYGDQFHLVIRKPPFDEAGLISTLDRLITVEEKDGKSTKVNANLIDIEIEDVIQESLSYDDKNAVSWYHLTPQYNFIGNASSYSLAYLPAIYFQEYAEVWGNRPLELSHNYMPRIPLDPSSSNLDLSERQAYEDLKYMVETNAYLPFTRSGTIKTNGDRRLKRGDFVRYKSTGEIFYIESVQQHAQVSDDGLDRSTTLEVSRGMIETLIRGNNANAEDGNVRDVDYGYFNIVNTKIPDWGEITKEVEDIITERVQTGTKQVEQFSDQIISNETLIVGGSTSNAKENFKRLIGRAESGGSNFTKDGKLIKNRMGSSAKGKYQVIDSTWADIERQLGRRMDKYSPVDNEAVMNKLLSNYEAALKRAGLALNGTNYYCMHFKGNTTWIKAAYNTPNASVWNYFKAIEIKQNPAYMRAGTVGGVLKAIARKMQEPVSSRSSTVNTQDANIEYIEVPVFQDKSRVVKKMQIDRSLVFKNFLVDRVNFNFFLRRLQNNKIYFTNTGNRIEEVVITKKID